MKTLRAMQFRFQSIQSGMAAAFVCLILFTALTMSAVAYRLSEDSAQQTAQQYAAELVKQVKGNIQTYIGNMENISLLAMNNRDVREYLSDKLMKSPSEQENDRRKIAEFFHTIATSRQDIASINVFGYDGRFVSDREDAKLNPSVRLGDFTWYRKAVEAKGEVVISPSHVQPVYRDEYRWVVSLSRELRGTGETEGSGVFLVDLNFNVINDIVSSISLGRRGYVFIVDNEGNLVYHPQQQLIYSKLKTELIDKVLAAGSGSFRTDEGGQSRIYTIEDSGFGWKIVGVSYVDELIVNKTRMRISFLLWGTVCLLAAFTMSVFLSRRLSRPILQLQEHMKEVEKGNFDIQVPVEQTKEIGRLAKTFNLMVGRIKELMAQVVKEQEFKRRTELNALQAQINPHFLYNTLDSIIWMAEGKKSEEVVLMTSALAKLFRASISKGEELVPIRTEIEHITNYLTIQKIRYRDKLEFRIDVDPGILSFKTLKIVLQPLVENAIYHGIKNKFGVGVIAITGEKRDGDIVLKVIDNGVGMEPEQVKRLLVPNGTGGEGKGYGLFNVHERIKLFFGPAYGLSVESEPDKGTDVTVRMAAIRTEDGKQGGAE